MSTNEIDNTQNQGKSTTIADLRRLLCEDVNKTPLSQDTYRYVMYCRKSTTDEDHQYRSLADQELECTKYAQNNNLHYDKTNIIHEKQSAKDSDNRPKFNQMLAEIRTGKYDGILCWHPDRLSRNMKEAGIIIDMIDKGIIKDLKFPSYTFTNDTSGKMNLGITFVLAKQYTDHISEQVRRGIRNAIGEGKLIGRPKHGYYKDAIQFARPDPKTWKIVRQAWKMRLQGARLEDVAKFMNNSGYQKVVKLDDYGHMIYSPGVMDAKKVSSMFQDPFYAGLLKFGEESIALQEIYDFVPVVTPDEFFEINQLNDNPPAWLKQRIRYRDANIKADLMRGVITCSGCGKNRSAGITTKKTKTGKAEYFYYKCETAGCPQHNKSINADRVLAYAIDFLKTHTLPTDKAYDQYIANFEAKRKEQLDMLQSQRVGLQNQLSRASEKINMVKETIYKLRGNPESKELLAEYQSDLKETMKTKDSITTQLEAVREDIEVNHALPMTRDEFLETVKRLPDLLATAKTLQQKDEVVRKIFSNFTVEGQNVLNHALNSTYSSFLGLLFCGTVGRERLELSTNRLRGDCSTD